MGKFYIIIIYYFIIGMTKILKYSLFLISYLNQRNEILNFGIKQNEIFRIKIERNEIKFCYKNKKN